MRNSFNYSESKSKSQSWDNYSSNFNSEKFIPNFSVAYLEAVGKSKIWLAYAENFAGEEIMQEGFNPNSGYVYIALENGISIASAFGHPVEYIVFEHDNGEELFFDSYQELEKYLNPED
jgi:hypothetical protein